jgi:hypothetical protein
MCDGEFIVVVGSCVALSHSLPSSADRVGEPSQRTPLALKNYCPITFLFFFLCYLLYCGLFSCTPVAPSRFNWAGQQSMNMG